MILFSGGRDCCTGKKPKESQEPPQIVVTDKKEPKKPILKQKPTDFEANGRNKKNGEAKKSEVKPENYVQVDKIHESPDEGDGQDGEVRVLKFSQFVTQREFF